jgi:hypothetical protein
MILHIVSAIVLFSIALFASFDVLTVSPVQAVLSHLLLCIVIIYCFSPERLLLAQYSAFVSIFVIRIHSGWELVDDNRLPQRR